MSLTKENALAGNRTRNNCLEGNYANHYTTSAADNWSSSERLREAGCWVLISSQLVLHGFLTPNIILLSLLPEENALQISFSLSL